MRLPSNVLMRLCLASTVIGCEPVHRPDPDPEPAPTPVERSTESLADEFHMLPAVAPKYAQPQPQPQQQQQPLPVPQPQPQVVKQKPKRHVQTSICGHPAPPNATPEMLMVRCGRG